MIIVAVFTAVWVGIIGLGLRWRGTDKLFRLERGFGAFCLIQWLVFHGWWLLPANFSVSRSLPIHLCDIVTLIMAIALLWRKRVLVSLLYFWGIGFSLQGICTPDLQFGLLSPWFWLFWFHHATIVGTASYMVVVHHFYPMRKDFRWAVKAGLLYVACVFPIDAIFGFNYGYLGRSTPSQPSLIDWLGPWPWRVGGIIVLAWIGMMLLLAPWEWVRRYHRHHDDGMRLP